MSVISRHFGLAKKASKKSNLRVKIGVCLVSDRVYISCNIKKTHPMLVGNYDSLWSTHAEARVLQRARDGPKYGLFVYREDSKGNVKLARPCKKCLGFIKKYSVKKIYYSIDNFSYGVISNTSENIYDFDVDD
jgi:tRNA(Arg) A34 adenosine deaminase TadA